MLVTIAVPVIAAGGTLLLLWSKRVGIAAGLIVFLCGFETASTGLAGPVNQLLTAMVSAIGHH